MNSIAHVKDTFLYYAYGSNLLKKRIRINNPSAEFLGIGRLDVSTMFKNLMVPLILKMKLLSDSVKGV